MHKDAYPSMIFELTSSIANCLAFLLEACFLAGYVLPFIPFFPARIRKEERYDYKCVAVCVKPVDQNINNNLNSDSILDH